MKLINSSSIQKTLLGGLAAILVGCGSQSESFSNSNDGPNKESSTSSEMEGFSPNSRWHQQKPSESQFYIENFADLNMKMIWIPGGDVEILEGPDVANSYGPGFTKINDYVEGFWISETEVSIGQWLAIRERDTGYNPSADTYKGEGGNPKDIRNPQLPATELSFLNAKRFVDYLTARTGKDYDLPTFSEWLMASRGPEIPSEGVYGDINKENANVWFDYNVRFSKEPPLLPVKHLQPNKFGLYGMFGNASEFLVIPEDSIFFNKENLQDNTRFKDGLIALAPSIYTSIEKLKDPYNKGIYPNIFSCPVRHSDLFYGPGFRVVRRPSETD